MKFYVEIRRFPLRSKSRIIIVHQPVCMRVRSFVRLTEDMSAPVSLVSSRPKCTSPKSTTPRTGTTCSPPSTSQAPFLQLITTLLSPGTSKRRCVSDDQMTMPHPKDHCHHVVFLIRILSRFQFQQNMPRVLKLFRQRESLSPRVACLEFRSPGVTQETREKTFPVVRSTRKMAFPLRAVPMILLGQFDVVVPPHFVAAPVTDSSQYLRPFASLGQLTNAHVSSPVSANVVDCAFSTAEPQ